MSAAARVYVAPDAKKARAILFAMICGDGRRGNKAILAPSIKSFVKVSFRLPFLEVHGGLVRPSAPQSVGPLRAVLHVN